MWLGPNFDPDELFGVGSRGRRQIRGKYVWQQTAAMVRLLAECGLPHRKFLPVISDELLARCAAADDEGGLDTRALSREQRRTLTLLYEGAASYNGQFAEEEEMIDLMQFKQLVLGLWPSGAAADGSESVEGDEDEEDEEGEEDEEDEEGEEGEEDEEGEEGEEGEESEEDEEGGSEDDDSDEPLL